MKCPQCGSENTDDSRFCKSCATPLPASQPTPPLFTETLETASQELVTGSLFAGRYQIIEELGRGGMGRVYRALDKKLNEEVALKLVRPEIAADRPTLERFHNELKLARKISHPSVGRMYELMEEAGTHFITMEYVPGQDLRGLIRQTGQLTAGKAITIGKEICEGLVEAHKQGIVHRDLKPSNIIIDRSGDARIMDFGIARSMAVKSRTGAGVMIGTPEYMSPEQVEGKEVDERSDLYSLGIILYEMLTGRVPFAGDTPFTVGMKHKGETPKNPKLLNPNIPDELSGVVLKCLEKDKTRRFQSATELRAELERLERGLPATEKARPSAPATSRQITVSFNPRKLVIPAAVILVIVAAMVVIFSVLPGRKPAPPASGKPTIAVVNFENKTGDSDLDKWSTGIRDLLITDLAQSKFMDVLSDSDIYGILRGFGLAETSTYSTADLVKIADAGGAQYTVNGSFLKAGDDIIINATCQKPHSRDVISPIQLTCRGFGEITVKIDEMTRRIKADLNLTQTQIESDIDQNIGEISTPNAEAWAYYVESRRYHFREEPQKAIPLLQKALSLDPEFIMASRALGSAYFNIGEFSEHRENFARTLELIQKHPERISDRDRYFIEQDYYAFAMPEQEWGKSLEAGRKLLALYPDHPFGNYEIGVVYSDIEDWDEALRYYEKSVRARSRFASTYTSMAEAYRAKNDPARAQEILERYLREVENTASGHQDLAYHYMSKNRFDLAGRELETAETLAPDDWANHSFRGDLLFLRGDLVGAEAKYRPLLEEKLPVARYYGCFGLSNLLLLEGRYAEIKKTFGPLIEEWRSTGVGEGEWNGRFAVAYSAWRSGRPAEAVDECQRAYSVDAGRWDLAYKRRTLHLKGFVYLGSRQIDEAEKTAGELKVLIETGLNRKAMRLYDHLMGAIELARNDTPKALDFLERAVQSLPYGRFEKNAWFIDTLAEAYMRAGDWAKARENYEHITALTTGRLTYADVYSRSFYHLGQIDEKLGDKARARENYEKFLDLRKNADPGLPDVADAKRRLAAL